MVSLNTVVRVLHGDVQSAGQVDGFVRPACGRCRRVVRLAKPYQGQRVCRRCIAQVRAVPCSRCGAVREPATRDGAGKPLCPRSLSTDPVNQEQCLRCGRCRPVSVRTNDGPICPTCRPLPVLTCAICGTDAPCEISRATGQPWCRACRQRWARCAGCGQSQPIRGGTRAEPLCSACTRAEPGFWKQCPTCGLADRLSDGQCPRCVLETFGHRSPCALIPAGVATTPASVQVPSSDSGGAKHRSCRPPDQGSTTFPDCCTGCRKPRGGSPDHGPARLGPRTGYGISPTGAR